MKKKAIILSLLFAMPIIMLAQKVEGPKHSKERGHKFEQMIVDLNLTPLQVTEIEKINDTYKVRAEETRKIEIEEDRKRAMKELRSQQKNEISLVLDETQREAFKDYHVKRKKAKMNGAKKVHE